MSSMALHHFNLANDDYYYTALNLCNILCAKERKQTETIYARKHRKKKTECNKSKEMAANIRTNCMQIQ